MEATDMRVAPPVSISEAQRERLVSWANGRKSAVRLAQRAQMILLAAQGWTDKHIAKRLHCGRRAVAR